MISLDGLDARPPGGAAEARDTLLTFAQHLRDGLLPNLFPEGDQRRPLSHGRCDDVVLPRHRSLRDGDRGRRDAARCCCRRSTRSCEHHRARHARSAFASIRGRPADAGRPGVCRSRGWTPRWATGSSRRAAARPVEINALWFNASACSPDWRRLLGVEDFGARRRCAQLAQAFVQSAVLVRRVAATSTTSSTAKRRRRLVSAESDPVVRASPSGAGPVAVGGGARRRVRATADAVRSANARPGSSRLQGAVLRRPARARRRLSPGHGLGLAHRAVHRCLAARAPGPPRSGAGVPRRASTRIWTTPASAASARSSTPPRLMRPGAASRRPGASPRCSALLSVSMTA